MKSLQGYLDIGVPIQVISENGLLTPYEFIDRDLFHMPSAPGPHTGQIYRSCLERIPGEPFNPKDFKKYSREKIHHLFLNMDFTNKEEWFEACMDPSAVSKIDYALNTVKSIYFAAMDDSEGLREHKPWATKKTVALYEIKFINGAKEPSIDLYLKRPSKEEVKYAISRFRTRRAKIAARAKEFDISKEFAALDVFDED